MTQKNKGLLAHVSNACLDKSRLTVLLVTQGIVLVFWIILPLIFPSSLNSFAIFIYELIACLTNATYGVFLYFTVRVAVTRNV